MMAKAKLWLPLLMFTAFCLWVGAQSWWPAAGRSAPTLPGAEGEPRAGRPELDANRQGRSFFYRSEYFFTEKGRPRLRLDADEILLEEGRSTAIFSYPRGHGLDSEGQKIFFQAEEGFLHRQRQFVEFKRQVRLFTDESELESDYAHYLLDKDRFFARGQVHTQSRDPQTQDLLQVKADQVQGRPQLQQAIYQGNVQGELKRRRPYERGVRFWADRLEALLNKSYIELEGSVTLVRGPLTAQARRGEIFLDNFNKRLKYFLLHDDVVVTEEVSLPGGESFQRKALSELLEGREMDRKVILTGNPRVIQQDENITGNKITLYENKEVVEVEDANTNLRVRP